VIEDHKTHRLRIPVYFFNGGRTPARNFRASVTYSGHNSKESIDLGLARFEIVSGPFRGGFLSSGGVDIPAQSTYVQYLDPDDTPTKKMLANPLIHLFGRYAYCDEFGRFHCQALGLTYDKTLSRFKPGPFMGMDCPPSPAVPSPQPASVRVLKRCKQPQEEKTIQAIEELNAGRVFPPVTPSPTPPTGRK
jgi:hypothetical protein